MKRSASASNSFVETAQKPKSITKMKNPALNAKLSYREKQKMRYQHDSESSKTKTELLSSREVPGVSARAQKANSNRLLLD
jgi:hypothetical protein